METENERWQHKWQHQWEIQTVNPERKALISLTQISGLSEQTIIVYSLKLDIWV